MLGLRAGLAHARDVLLAPRLHRVHDGPEALPDGREAIFDAGRYRLVLRSRDESLGLELLELHRERSVRHPGHLAQKLVEVQGAVFQIVQDRRGPLACDEALGNCSSRVGCCGIAPSLERAAPIDERRPSAIPVNTGSILRLCRRGARVSRGLFAPKRSNPNNRGCLHVVLLHELQGVAHLHVTVLDGEEDLLPAVCVVDVWHVGVAAQLGLVPAWSAWVVGGGVACHDGLLDELLPRFLQDTFLEVGPRAEEFLVRGGGRVLTILDCGELHGADVIRRLRKPVF